MWSVASVLDCTGLENTFLKLNKPLASTKPLMDFSFYRAYSFHFKEITESRLLSFFLFLKGKQISKPPLKEEMLL